MRNENVWMNREWKNITFAFLKALNDDFENIRSQILNFGSILSIDEVYAQCEADEQHR